MKKTRILAALLCVVMVVCSLPMMQASAALTGVDFNTIGALIGKASAVPVENHATWFGMNFDFKDNFSQTAGITLPTGCSYDNTNGLNFAAGSTLTWTYFPSGSTQWSPLVLGAYTVRFKLDQGGTLGFQACELYSHDRSMIEFSNTGVTVYEGDGAGSFQGATKINEFVPGTDWIDMVVAPSGSGYAVYTKKATDKNFTHVATAADYRPGGNWRGTGMTIYGQGAHVSDAIMLEPSDVTQGPAVPEVPVVAPEIPYDAVGVALGGVTSEAHPGDANWSPMALDFTDNFDPATTGLSVTEGITFDNDKGAVFPAASSTLRYYNPTSVGKWSPLCNGNWGFGFKLEEGGALNAQACGVWTNNRAFMDISTTGITIYDYGTAGQGVATKLVDYAPGTEWNDLLITTNTNGGYDVYMKKASDAAFTKVASTTSYRSNGDFGGTGAQLVGADVAVSYSMCFTEPTLALTTSVGGEILENGAAIASGASLYPTVKSGVSGKLLLVTYDANDNMVKAQIANAQNLTDGQSFAVAPSGAAKVKVFLWNNFTSLTSLNDVVTLNIQ